MAYVITTHNQQEDAFISIFDERSILHKPNLTMYHNIASSIRSKLSSRGSSSSLASSFVALPLSYRTPTTTTRVAISLQPTYHAPTHQATLSLSMFATVGSAAGGDGLSSSSNEQRRPFWATRPIDNETTKTPTINTIDHSVNAAATTAGISMEDIKKAAAKAKKADSVDGEKEPKKSPKKKKAKKEEADGEEEVEEEDEEEIVVDDEEDLDLPPDQDSITPIFMSKVIAAKHKGISVSKAKRIVDDIFDMVIDVRIIFFGSIPLYSLLLLTLL